MQPTFRELIASNKRKSFWLVAFFCLFIASAGFVFSLALLQYLGFENPQEPNWLRSLIIGGIASGIAFCFSMLGYFQGDQFVLGISGAKPIVKSDDPQLFNVVEEMAIAAGIPMPAVYLIDDAAPNAFATGRDPEHATVAITTGLRTKLNRDELQGVIAHEMAHVRNYDIRLMLLLAVLIGTIVMMSDFFMQVLRVTPAQPQRNRDDDNPGSNNQGQQNANPFLAVVFVLAIVLAVLAPILARLIQFAVSRQREYLADASAVEFTRDPRGLIGALKLLESDPTPMRHANRGTAHLYIVNPIKKFSEMASTVFSSHPPTPMRIERLSGLIGR